MLVTYHDPCHLGRMGEPFLADWKGDKLQRPMSHEARRAARASTTSPAQLIAAIPGLELTEMERIREYSWCCGAGGGVLEAFPEFAAWTATGAAGGGPATGAEALVTACPWCVRVFRDAVAEAGSDLPVYDLADLVMLSAGITAAAKGEGVRS